MTSASVQIPGVPMAAASFVVASLRWAVVEHLIIPDRVVFSCAGRHDRSRCLVVELTSDTGAVGYGEASCVAIWSGETAATAGALCSEVLRPALVGQTFDSPVALCDAMDRTLIDNHFLKSAVDMAAWDMLARREGVSVASLIADRPLRDRLPTRASIAAHPVERTVQLAREFFSLGIKTLKFKVGLDTDEDVRRLGAVRDALGDGPVLTVDYNAGLPTVETAVRAIRALEPFDLALVEQPTPRHRPAMMAAVRREVKPLILADEGIFNRAQLDEAIELNAIDAISLYPGKNGGVTRSWQMAHTAQQAGIPCVIGSNLEPEYAQAAMGCLAGSLEAFSRPDLSHDLLSAMYYSDNPITAVRPLVGGCYALPQGPGFGVEIDAPELAWG